MGNLLDVRDLRVRFKTAAPDRWAVNGVSFSMKEGEILGLVGESGSGKSVTAMSVSGLLPRDKTEVQGSITLDGTAADPGKRSGCGLSGAHDQP